MEKDFARTQKAKKHTDQDKMDIKQGKGWKGKKERERGVLVLCKRKVLSLTLAVGSIGTRKTMSGEEEKKKPVTLQKQGRRRSHTAPHARLVPPD